MPGPELGHDGGHSADGGRCSLSLGVGPQAAEDAENQLGLEEKGQRSLIHRPGTRCAEAKVCLAWRPRTASSEQGVRRTLPPEPSCENPSAREQRS